MVGWDHRFNGPEFEQSPGDGEGQGSLVCSSLWAAKSQTHPSSSLGAAGGGCWNGGAWVSVLRGKYGEE